MRRLHKDEEVNRVLFEHDLNSGKDLSDQKAVWA
jgi:hypothetical protein